MPKMKTVKIVFDDGSEQELTDIKQWRFSVDNGLDEDQTSGFIQQESNGRRRIVLTGESHPGMPLDSVKTVSGTFLKDR